MTGGLLKRLKKHTRTTRDPAMWGLSHQPQAGLHLGNVELTNLTATYGSPLHVVDAQALDRNSKAAFEPLRSNDKGADVFSSYKTNPVPAVLRRLHSNGVGAEAISAFELWLAFELGVPADRIIYNGPAKSYSSLQLAAERGLFVVNANSPSDLENMERAASSVGRQLRSGIRIAMPHMWGGQFGIPHESADVNRSVALAIASPHLELIGLHFHSGFALRDHAAVVTHASEVLGFCDRLREETGWHPDLVDMGGSLTCATVVPKPRRPLPWRADETPPAITIAEASALLWQMFDQHFEATSVNAPQIVIEPGKALTANTQMLLATVLDVRDATSTSIRSVVIDAGVEIAEPARSGDHQIFNASHPDRAVCSHQIVGPDGDARDVLVSTVTLARLEVGDTVAIMDSGAYFVPFSTASSRPRPAIVMLDDSDISVVRRRQTTDDLLLLDDC